MSRKLDDALAHLASSPTHPGLEGLEDRVLLAIRADPVGTIGFGATITAALFALTLGAISNVFPTANAQAAPIQSPFGASSPLAPSTLLTAPR